MNIRICESVRRLRRERGITQEKLADALGVTMQAVSKWERGEALPDLTMVLPLASYFNVSADELLGADRARDEARIAEYLAENTRLANVGKNAEQLELIRTAHKEFPNDFRIMEEYVWLLNYDGNDGSSFSSLTPSGKHGEELIRICNRILDECTLDAPRYRAMFELAMHYAHEQDYEKAAEIAQRFPEPTYFNKGAVMEQLYPLGSAERQQHTRKNLWRHVDNLLGDMLALTIHGTEPPCEKIRLMQKSLDLLVLIFEDGDFGFNLDWAMANFNLIIAKYHVELGEYDAALQRIECGMAYAKQYDELPNVVQYTSYFVRGYETDMREIWHLYEGNAVHLRLEELHRRYDGTDFAETDGFREIISKYAPFARGDAHRTS